MLDPILTPEIYDCLLNRYEDERQQWAQSLHDGPLQTLQALGFALLTLTESVQTLPTTSDPTTAGAAVAAELAYLRSDVVAVARSLRSLGQTMRPPTLIAFGLASAIGALAESVQSSGPTPVIQLDLVNDQRRLSQPLRLALFAICQHLLQNIIDHADAQTATVRLQLADQDVILEVSDDGCGFELPADWGTMVRQRKLGLVIAIQRAQAVGGRFELQSTLGAGTKIRITAPLQPVHRVGQVPSDKVNYEKYTRSVGR